MSKLQNQDNNTPEIIIRSLSPAGFRAPPIVNLVNVNAAIKNQPKVAQNNNIVRKINPMIAISVPQTFDLSVAHIRYINKSRCWLSNISHCFQEMLHIPNRLQYCKSDIFFRETIQVHFLDLLFGLFNVHHHVSIVRL